MKTYQDPIYQLECEHAFHQYLETIRLPDEALFETDADLWPIYMAGFTDPVERQHYNCSACKRFIESYGNLVTINPVTGEATSAVWEPMAASVHHFHIIQAMAEAVEKAKVVNVFYSSERVLGTPVTGEWRHLSAVNPNPYVKRGLLTARQYRAEKKQDRINVSRFLGPLAKEILETACSVLRSDALYRSEKVLGAGEWLLELKTRKDAATSYSKSRNIVWKAVADAPTGFCHPRSSMIGTLIEDIESGIAYADISNRFKSKMHPLQYQRPTAAPSDGAIKVAEQLVKELGVELSLERRYAQIHDMQLLWQPTPSIKTKDGGVFAHLKSHVGTVPHGALDGGTITWTKFERDVLPGMSRAEVIVPHGPTGFIVCTAPQHEEAPTLFQWGNGVGWYSWHNGARAAQFGLRPGAVECVGISLSPCMWNDGVPMGNRPPRVMFLLKGARETKNHGNALFPETLRYEFHGIRKVVESYSRNASIYNVEGDHAVGLGFGTTIRVHGNVVTDYTIDRWE